MLRGSQIVEHIRRDPKIPAPCQTVSRVLALTRHHDCDIKRLVDVISQDGGLTAMLLRQANSAFYGFKVPTSCVAEACTRLGLKRVRAAVVNQHVVDGLGRARPPGFEPGRYWQAAFATSVAAKDLSLQLTPAIAEDAGTAGLLCDVGVGLMAYGLPKAYQRVLDVWHSHSDEDLEKVERRILGVTHADVGAAVLADWKIDEHIVDAVWQHHASPHKQEGMAWSRFSQIVAAAVVLAHIALDGSDMDRVETLFAHVDVLTPDADSVVGRLLDGLVQHVQETAESFTIELGPLEAMEKNFAGLQDLMPDAVEHRRTRV